ncbi:MAG: ImmA/IrrE family metallo-endopeptidase [Phycisphaeraceae bacterium]|nr:ImmA/IrrE family metallo-endopeptidase [Phycisphaeraceae bacterium]
MTGTFNHDMLVLARESRGMNRTELAERLNISQPYVSHMEGGHREPSAEVLDRLCTTLGYPRTFFFQQDERRGLGLSVMFYRKKAATKAADIHRLEAEVNIRRMLVRRLISEVDISTPHRVEFLDIDEHGHDPEKIAALVRASWQLPSGPVQNLVRVIEAAGGIVFKFRFGTRDIDAISMWPKDTPPLFFINEEAPADRVRFSLCHELGHVVMHESATETMEDEANRFASEFLMPESLIGPELSGMTLTRAASLKPVWRVSMASLVYRARELGRISDLEFEHLFRRLSVTGQRKREMVDIPGEDPILIDDLLKELRSSAGHTTETLAQMLCLHEADFVSRFERKPGELKLTT